MKEEKIELRCPNCDYLMKKIKISDIGKKEELELVCDKCKHPISIKLSKRKTFYCEGCGKEFGSKEEAKKHEKTCKKEQQKFQVFCPYCNSERSIIFNLSGETGELTCSNCNKKFKFAFGKVKSATGLTGYVARQGFIRIIINNKEEEISWYSDSEVNLKSGDLILIIWKKRLLNKNKPYCISNFMTGMRTLL